VDSNNDLSAKNKALLEQFESKWLELFQLIESAYKADFIKDWETARKKFFNAHKRATDKFFKTHKIDKINLSASEEIYSLRIAKHEERLSMSLSNPNPFRKVQSPQSLLFNKKAMMPFLSPKDIGYVEGLIQGWENFEIEIKKERAYKVPDVHKEFSYIASLIEDTNTVDQMLAEKKTLKETLLGNPEAAKIISENPAIEQMVDAFSGNLDYTKKTLNNRNPNLGTNSKKTSDKFADSITDDLNKVREEGHTSTRAIADRFNELGIKTPRGGAWHHNSVARLLRRRKELGLEGQEGSEPDVLSMD
tara:strand:- start:619 stop:1533 length:915 start_codon:yes stop_codon:yes gene_type:complete